MIEKYDIPPDIIVEQDLFFEDEADISSFDLAQLSSSFEVKRESRDEAALLLKVAAEVEHALMVQYLYAAYSVRDDQTHHETRGRVRSLYQRLAQIAREEMGHLITVQNLLHLIGAPLNFDRKHSPFESKLYPFRFKLEPLSKQSLAKYITAERPAKKGKIDDETWQRLSCIAKIARRGNDARPIQHMGVIYERLLELFSNAKSGLQDRDFQTEQSDRQATWNDWGYDESLSRDQSRRVHVSTFEGSHPDTLRKQAVQAIKTIVKQGESYSSKIDSHFKRFLQLYDDFLELDSKGVKCVWPVATNPSTTLPDPIWGKNEFGESIHAAFKKRGYIENPHARNWGDLFNLRYRLLLGFLIHFLRITGRRYVSSGTDKGDRTPRGLLLLWTFDEMRHLKKVAQKMVRLPLKSNYDGVTSGPPFQLPYTLDLADLECDCWRVHLDVVKTSLTLVEKVLQDDRNPDWEDPFLEDLQKSDMRRVSILEALAAGQSIPTYARTKSFQKVVHILEEAVRGFSIDDHSNFWAGIDRKEFLKLNILNQPFLRRNEDDNCKLTAEGSELVSRLESSTKTRKMPRYRPSVDSSRQEFIREWIDNQAPDSEPGGQIGVHHEREPNLDPLPTNRKPYRRSDRVGYESDIRPLFREFDVEILQRLDGIDLDDVESVRVRGEELRERLHKGSLPYDACWSDDLINLFDCWLDGGMED